MYLVEKGRRIYREKEKKMKETRQDKKTGRER